MSLMNKALERVTVRLVEKEHPALTKLIIKPHGNTYTPRGYSFSSRQTDASMLAAEAEVVLNPKKQAKDANGKPLEVDGEKIYNHHLMYWQYHTGPDGLVPLGENEKFEVAKQSSGGFDLEAYLNGGVSEPVEEPVKEPTKPVAPEQGSKETATK